MLTVLYQNAHFVLFNSSRYSVVLFSPTFLFRKHFNCSCKVGYLWKKNCFLKLCSFSLYFLRMFCWILDYRLTFSLIQHLINIVQLLASMVSNEIIHSCFFFFFFPRKGCFSVALKIIFLNFKSLIMCLWLFCLGFLSFLNL